MVPFSTTVPLNHAAVLGWNSEIVGNVGNQKSAIANQSIEFERDRRTKELTQRSYNQMVFGITGPKSALTGSLALVRWSRAQFGTVAPVLQCLSV